MPGSSAGDLAHAQQRGLRGFTVDLDEQHGRRARIDRDAGRADGIERGRVEQLEAPRYDAGSDDGADGVRPRRRTSAKSASTVATAGGFGTRRSVASVNTPSVPSLPTRSAVTS